MKMDFCLRSLCIVCAIVYSVMPSQFVCSTHQIRCLLKCDWQMGIWTWIGARPFLSIPTIFLCLSLSLAPPTSQCRPITLSIISRMFKSTMRLLHCICSLYLKLFLFGCTTIYNVRLNSSIQIECAQEVCAFDVKNERSRAVRSAYKLPPSNDGWESERERERERAFTVHESINRQSVQFISSNFDVNN